MRVTKLEPVTKTKYKVYLEEQFAFVLYKGELSRYKIRENTEISQETIEELKREVLLKRAKRRALYLLDRMDRTESQLRRKLEGDLYPEDVTLAAVDYVKSFGYVEDADYARRYILSRKSCKSKREISAALFQKGISKETINQAMEECYHNQDDLAAAQRLAEKKRFHPKGATPAEKRKMYGYLARKGFSDQIIRQVIQVSFWNA